MSGRDDLDELHALAASIADDAHGWRAHRRTRAQAAALRRLEAAMVAPVKRRRRHRWVAAVAVGLALLVAITLLVVVKPSKPAASHVRTSASVKMLPPQVRAGQVAAISLHQLGRTADVFSCQSWYEWQNLAAVPVQRTTTWRAGYLQACADGG